MLYFNAFCYIILFLLYDIALSCILFYQWVRVLGLGFQVFGRAMDRSGLEALVVAAVAGFCNRIGEVGVYVQVLHLCPKP